MPMKRAALALLASACATAGLPDRKALSDGAPPALASLRGKVVLLDFWATWCEPCKVTMPAYARLESELGPRGFAVLSVNTDTDDDRVRGFLSSTPLALRVARDPSGVYAQRLGVENLPTVFLLDRNGTARFRFDGVKPDHEARVRAAVEELLR
jgi:thiol-disulfide isomerase/thioredoxin